jgi:hypothetical protein
MDEREIICPFCSLPLRDIEPCPHYLGGGDRGNEDDFNEALSTVACELSGLLGQLDNDVYDRIIDDAPIDLVELFESAYVYGKYFWMHCDEVIVTHFYTDVSGTSADNEDCFHYDRETFIEKAQDDAERAIIWLNTHSKYVN